MRLFFTETTPRTPEATRPAAAFCSGVLTKPLSCTTPLTVSTLTAKDFTSSLPKSALLILVVTTVSSMYSPVLSLVGVEAQPPSKVPSARVAVRVNRAVSFETEDVFMGGVGWVAVNDENRREGRIG